MSQFDSTSSVSTGRLTRKPSSLWSYTLRRFSPAAVSNSVGYLVLGMHRSGTSCLTGLLESQGLFVGNVSRANPFNKKGTRENPRINGINDAILSRAGGSWRQPPASVPADQMATRKIRHALRDYLRHETWLLKDPRLTLTLDSWLPVIPHYRIVGSFRHPRLVAQSLAKRDGIPIDDGLQLWTDYNRCLVSRHRTKEFPLINFCLPPAAYLEQYRHLCNVLGLPNGGDCSEQFFESGLRTQPHSNALKLCGEAAQLYDYLLANQLSRSAGDRAVA